MITNDATLQVGAVGRRWVADKVQYYKDMMHTHEAFDDDLYVLYATFLYNCGTKFHANWTVHRANLRMLSGAFYDEETMHDMELHLMTHITRLTKLLKKEKLNEYLKYEKYQVGLMIKGVKTARTSTHSTKQRSVPLASENMRNRVRVAAGGVQAEIAQEV